MSDLAGWLDGVIARHLKWEAGFGTFERSTALDVPSLDVETALVALAERLTNNYPFFHPRYAGQMLKAPHPVAVAGYLAAMLVNPNNHALDGGPATAEMEVEAVAALARMFGFPDHLGHLTSSGTIANLEALFVARETHPAKGLAFSQSAHYTHSRMCRLIGMQGFPVGVDEQGRIDLDAVEDLARSGQIGTVVMTVGSTALGAVDRVEQALELRDRYGLRIHVDGAYGGFYSILGRDPSLSAELGLDPAPWQAIADCDSVVVDPHKHGLQPYGCGAVVFSDPSVARHYLHDSPYTYYTTAESGSSRHLGEISLECSRAGAAAAALWLTLQVFPLDASGLGRVLRETRLAGLEWSRLVSASEVLELYQAPELDIVCYFSGSGAAPPSAAAVDAATGALFDAGMADDGVFLSVLRVSEAELLARHRQISSSGIDGVRILRSVLMKPESREWAPRLVSEIEALARAADISEIVTR